MFSLKLSSIYRKDLLLKLLLLVGLFVIYALFNCSNITDTIGLDENNLVAFSAIYLTDSSYTGRIVITDYDNTENYKIVSPPGLMARDAVFSRTKNKLLFGLDGIIEHGYQFAIYDNQSDEMEKLYTNNDGDKIPLAGIMPIWDYDDKGFYFSQHNTYSTAMGIYYYDLATKMSTIIYNPKDASVYVIGLKSQDTLIVFSNKYFLASGDSNCFFFISKTGEYLSQINNPHLVLINKNGITQKGAYYLRWNELNQQFVYSAINSDQEGFAISITNIDGSFYKQYTSTKFDTRPIWGPGNSIIFFNRQIEYDDEEQLYMINTTTGQVEKFINPANIDGADQIVDAAY
ncbi:MAG: hypothetical protein PHW79_07810 [Candidatus Marinimicrobia bacterium]|nr:hypothetical protein [Candidatus Neomarinimicrobiota bacterium]